LPAAGEHIEKRGGIGTAGQNDGSSRERQVLVAP
jgi:hypothetical protein